MSLEELEKDIKKNCHLRKISILDLCEGYDKENEDDIDIFVDMYSTDENRAAKVGQYLSSLGFEIEYGDGHVFLPTDDNHPEWLIVHASRFN